jgi:uncharacterized protein (TIGR02391 family)
MDKSALSLFERIARRVHLFSDEAVRLDVVDHPFDVRNIHAALPQLVKHLFDDGHYAQATFEAFKYLDREVARIAQSGLGGFKLMMDAFKDQAPAIQLTPLLTDSQRDEQKGYQFIFGGSIMAIRNPRGHEYTIKDTLEDCLDHLGLVSMLLRRIEKAGVKVTT